MTPIIIGESVSGDSHIRQDVERQDNYLIIDEDHPHDRTSAFYNDISSDIKIIAVADGHGSEACPYSKTGSQTAVNVFCDTMAEFASTYKNNMEDLFVSLNREGETTRLSKWIVSTWENRILAVHAMNHRPAPKLPNGDYDAEAIWKQYGTTLLGMLVTKEFIFCFQLGDGDITYIDANRVCPAIEGDKILGVETHSISKRSSWQKALTRVIPIDKQASKPFMYTISTDGWINSHASEEDFHKTCYDYLTLISERGISVVKDNLESWLSETSKLGCGDDITVVIVYFDK